MSTFPVSGSTSTSTMLAEYDPLWPTGLRFALPTTGPPVSGSIPAISRNDMRSSVSETCSTPPSSYRTWSGDTSQIRAARSVSWPMMSRAASWAAQPDLKATPLPPVFDVKPMESVSPILGITSSTGMPRTSASCWAMTVREPPISTEPSMRLILPSSCTLAMTHAGPVLFRQKPMATPRP